MAFFRYLLPIIFCLAPVVWLHAGLKNSDCLDCHGDKTLSITNSSGRALSLFVDETKLKASAHGTNRCISCHSDATNKHPDDNVPLQRVDCGRCHASQVEGYNAGVHGLAIKAGNNAAASCQDCHDSHEILPANLPNSPLNYSHLAETCGACHSKEVADWSISVHGKAVAAGVRDAPTCTDCHSEHKTRAVKSDSSMDISAGICSRCHASEHLNTRYNLPADRVKTFFESYHGLAAQYGSTIAANCGSCHGFHKVLPSSDPQSTINKAHLVQTCGQCHPGAGEKFSFGRIHVDLSTRAASGDLSGQTNWWVRRIYLVLIFCTIGGMLAHNLLLFFRKVSARYSRNVRTIVRMSGAQRWQHFILASSFIILAVSGFALKFPDSWLAHSLGSSEPLRRWTHRIAGIILLLVGLWHLVYLLSSPDGRRLVRDLFPARKDLADICSQLRYLSGHSSVKPEFGRFGYAEKMEYWAVIWGTIIMGISGLMIWFKMDVTRFMPRWIVEVALTVHYYEAVLACLAIVVWHFYHVIFDPDVYPLNSACLDGRVSEEWQKHEHPLEAAIPASPATETSRSKSTSAAGENL